MEKGDFVTINSGMAHEECLKNLSDQYRLLSILAKYKQKIKGQKTKHETIVGNIVRYINEHMTEKIDAGILADHFHVSQSTIYRLFYKEMGLHLNEYITALRVSAACCMLQNQKQTVTEIAYACGFTGLSNFYRVFQKMMHMTPKEYQKKSPHLQTQYVLHQPDIMQLNQFQTFWETGYDVEMLKNVY